MKSSLRPLKVLIISTFFEDRRGGIELVAYRLAREWAERWFRVTWIACADRPVPETAEGLSRVSLTASNLPERLLNIPFPLVRPSQWHRIFSLVRQSDVIVAHDALYMTSVLARLAAYFARKPFVVIQHIGAVPYSNRALRLLMGLGNWLVARVLLRSADRVIFISQTTEAHFSGLHYRYRPEIIFNGVDSALFYPAQGREAIEALRCAMDLPVDVRICLFVGRFVEKKGLSILEWLAREMPEILFVFAGSGKQDPSTWQLDNVRVFHSLGAEKLAQLYRACDLFVLPSVGEGFPLVVQEALACGLPVICGSDVGRADIAAGRFLHSVSIGANDVTKDGRLVGAAIAEVLGRPLTEAERRQRAEFAATRYSWRASADRYAQIFLTLAGCLQDGESLSAERSEQ